MQTSGRRPRGGRGRARNKPHYFHFAKRAYGIVELNEEIILVLVRISYQLSMRSYPLRRPREETSNRTGLEIRPTIFTLIGEHTAL
jgi:hypothetical protein